MFDLKQPTAMLLGRYQTPTGKPHAGHLWLLNEALKEAQQVIVLIRESTLDEKNPLPTSTIFAGWQSYVIENNLQEKVMVMCVPNVTKIVYGREVGYQIVECSPPQNIAEVSASKLRLETKQKIKFDAQLPISPLL